MSKGDKLPARPKDSDMITKTTIQVSDTGAMTGAERRAARRAGIPLPTRDEERYIISGEVQDILQGEQNGFRLTYIIDGTEVVKIGNPLITKIGDHIEVTAEMVDGTYKI